MQDEPLLSSSTTRTLSGLIIVISLAVLAGSILQIPMLESIYPGWAPMPRMTALCFILFSLALWLLPSKTTSIKIPMGLCVALAMIISLLNIKYMPMLVSLNFLVIGIAFFLMMGNEKQRSSAQYFFILSLLMPAMAMLGYIYAYPSFFYLGGFNPISFITAILFLLLTFIALFSNPTPGMANVFSGTGPGSMFAKYVIPVAIVIPITFGYSRLSGPMVNVHNRELDISLMTLLILFSITPILWFTASWLNKIDKELQKNKVNLALALTSAKAGTWDWDLKTNAITGDAQCRQMLGLNEPKPFSTIGHFLNAIHAEDRKQADADIKSTVLDRTDYTSDFRVVHSNGTELTLTARGKAYYNAQGKPEHMYGILWDITDQRKTEEELRSAKLRAESADKIKSEFLANMSQGLKTPLNTVIGYSEMLRDKAAHEKLPEYAENLDKIVHPAKRLLDMLTDVLDLSKIEAGKMDLFFEEITPEALVKDLKNHTAELFEKNHNQFSITVSPNIGPIYMDILRLRQSLLNFLSNANKFTHDGKIILDITTCDLNNTPMIQFKVTDTGEGMSVKKIATLFQQLSPEERNQSHSHRGAGLGLYLTKRFCDIVAGHITVESQPKKGTTFTLTLPIRSSLVDEQDVRLHTETLNRFKGKKVLLISKKLALYADIERDLRKVGFSVLKASSGTEGLKLARTGSPDIIALDITGSLSLDDALMDQWIALSELKTAPKLSQIPLVVMTLENPEENLGFILKSIDFLKKPFSREVFIDKVNRLVPTGVPSLLIVDNDSSAREVITAMIKEKGWDYNEAKNGKEAIIFLRKQRPSLIILDLLMPEMNGFAFIEEIQKNPLWRNIPLIISSAKKLTQEEQRMLTKYTQGILQKGSDSAQDLLSLISENLK